MPFLSEAEARVTHLRAPMAGMVRSILIAAAGAETWARVLQDLEAETRRLGMPGAELPEWVPVEPLAVWGDAFRDRIGPSPIGQNLVDQLVEDAHPWLQKSLDPAMGAQAIPRIFRHYHRGGALDLTALEPGRAELELWAFLPYPGWHDQLLPAAMVRTVERCGGREVRIEMPAPASGDPSYLHRFRLAWR